MKRFKQYLNEGRYPAWVKVVVGGIVMRLNNLATQIQQETDPEKQNQLIAQQNKLLGYISGLGIAVNSNDPKLMTKLRGINKQS